MSCLVSYSESSDDDGNESLETHCSDANLCLSDHSEEKVLCASNNYFDSLSVNSKDIHNHDNGIESKISQRQMEALEPIVTRSSLNASAERFDTGQSKRKRKLACRCTILLYKVMKISNRQHYYKQIKENCFII